jgi:hypothetical protein
MTTSRYTIPLEQSTIGRCDDSVVLDNGPIESAAIKKNEEHRRREEILIVANLPSLLL